MNQRHGLNVCLLNNINEKTKEQALLIIFIQNVLVKHVEKQKL